MEERSVGGDREACKIYTTLPNGKRLLQFAYRTRPLSYNSNVIIYDNRLGGGVN